MRLAYQYCEFFGTFQDSGGLGQFEFRFLNGVNDTNVFAREQSTEHSRTIQLHLCLLAELATTTHEQRFFGYERV